MHKIIIIEKSRDFMSSKKYVVKTKSGVLVSDIPMG